MRHLNFILAVLLGAPHSAAFAAETVTVKRTVQGSVVTIKGGEAGAAEKIFKTLDLTEARSLPTRDGRQLTGKTIEAELIRIPSPFYSVDLKMENSVSAFELKQEKGSRLKIAVSGSVAQELLEALSKAVPASPTAMPEEMVYQTPELSCATVGAGISPTFSCLIQVNPTP